MKTHTLSLITDKKIRDALDTLMIAKPSRVIKILSKNYNETEIEFITANLEETLDYIDEEVKK